MKKLLVGWFVTVYMIFSAMAYALVPTSTAPLAGVTAADGVNVLLALSIEYPTAGWAHQTGYTTTNEYLGYFEPGLCYSYVDNDSSAGVEYFNPVSAVNNASLRTCNDGLWSGNFLNWATGTATDIFRKTLTGGYRVREATGKTILRMSRHGYGDDSRSYDDFQGYLPLLIGHGSTARYRDVTATLLRPTASPFSLTLTRSYQREECGRGCNWVKYNDTTTFDLNVRACVKSTRFGMASNCTLYTPSAGVVDYKPEGLIQKYAKTMRVGVLSYLLDDAENRDGGVLRARLKYPGCYQTVTTNSGNSIALGQEWDPKTGAFYPNPDPTDASNSSVSDSGVVNYLNRFGELGYKTLDPGAELYYAALRYLRNKGDDSAYSTITDDRQKDRFPVITDWEDPLTYSDQNNFILYFGDVNVHRDVDLPGSTWTDIPTRPPGDDSEINVSTLLNTVRNGGTSNIGSTHSPGYIAALAYWGNMFDIRGDKLGQQRVKAFMIDVVEGGSYKSETTNSFYLAAKWGGFDDSNGNKTPDVKSEWSSDLQTIGAFPNGVPDNYAPANNPEALIRALNRAFSYAALAVKPSLSGLSVSSGNNSVGTGSHLFRTTFERSSANSSDGGTDWYGDIEAYKVTLNSSNALNSNSLALDWSTKSILESQLGTTASGRNVYAYNKSAERGMVFDTGSSYLQTQIGLNAAGLAYLRGDNTNAGNSGSKAYRARSYRLGPIELAKVAFNGAPADISGCGSFSSNAKGRPAIYAVPANDGLLHIFNYGNKNAADKGKELFAFMPSAVYPQVARLAAKDYDYVRLHDGSPVIKDVCLNNTATTLLIGATGRGITRSDGYGSSSIYAIDVTTPTSMNAASVRWEFSSSNDSLLGNMMTLPKLVKLNNGKWAAVLGNGINQTASNAGVFLLMLDKAPGTPWVLGSNYFRLTVSPRSAPLYAPNGITDVSTDDNDNNGTADYLYAGDLNGNVWKFDISTPLPAAWRVALAGQPLFTAYEMSGGALGKRQPITAAPVLMKTASGQKMVVFGTGINYAEADRANSGQAIYGIYDNNQQITDPRSLLAQEVPSADVGFSRTSTSSVAANQKGWYIPLTSNEQVVSSPFYLSLKKKDLVVVDSIRLRQECAAGGEAAFRTIVNLSNGAAPDRVLMDTNGDGKVSSQDSQANRQLLKTGLNYGGSLLLTLPNGKQALCHTGVSGNVDCQMLGSRSRVVRRVSWREIILD